MQTPWIGGFRPTPRAKLTLFCFPYAGGTAAIYRDWPALIPDLIDVCPVHLPGRGGRIAEPAYRNLLDTVNAAGEALRPHLDRPYAFFGHSMGAMIAFDLARYFRRNSLRMPVQLFVSGRPAPQFPDPDPPTYDLPDAEFLNELRRLNGTPAEMFEHEELIGLLMPLLRADFEAVQTYVYSDEPPLDCPITAFGGLQDHEITRESLDLWRTQTTNKFTLRMLPGDHFFLHAQQRILNDSVCRDLYPLLLR